MNPLRLALAQINPVVGDLEGNCRKILDFLDRAAGAGADLVAFPEMAVTGYPPEDLLFKPDFIAASMAVSHRIAAAARGLTAVFGNVHLDRDLFNAAIVAHDGVVAGVYCKRHLPNYGVFDENRYFQAGEENLVFERNGFCFGVSVCEDIWRPGGPPAGQADAGAMLLLNLSASPYHMGKGEARERMLSVRAADETVYVAYCNLVGGQDELVFDGRGLVCDPRGEILARGAQFAEDLVLVDLKPEDLTRTRMLDPRRRKPRPVAPEPVRKIALSPVSRPARPPLAETLPRTPLAPLEEVRQALVLGLGDYVRKSGFKKAVIGLSGGVDSSLTTVLAVQALGPENVVGVAMPSRYSSDHSLDDAVLLAKNLGVRLETIGVEGVFSAYLSALAPLFGERPQDVTEENLQPRIRGALLMALSNKFGWLVLTTGNKSEAAVGYSTLYGDTAGGFAVIKDVSKLLVYDLCRHINAAAGREIVPARVLTKAPSAELRPDQKDSDSLPPYEALDPILEDYVEEGLSPAEIAERQGEAVAAVIRMVDRNEYKRRQSPPGVKITCRAFGKDWRLPIVNRYRGGS